jgi:hypothetical protein
MLFAAVRLVPNDAKCHLRPSPRRKKAESLFIVSDEPPYGSRCRERATPTTSIATGRSSRYPLLLLASHRVILLSDY